MKKLNNKDLLIHYVNKYSFHVLKNTYKITFRLMNKDIHFY